MTLNRARSTATSVSVSSMTDYIDILDEHIDRLERRVEDARTQYEPDDCPHCGREVEFGRSDGGKITYGCYPPLGSGSDGHDCPYFREHGYAYTIEKSIKDTNAEKRALRELEKVRRRFDREVDDGE